MSVKLFVGTTNGLALKVDERALDQLSQEQENRLKKLHLHGGTWHTNKTERQRTEEYIQRLVDSLRIREGCWEYSKGKDQDGYGQVKVCGRSWRAHRFIYFLTYAELNCKMVCHTCDNPPCIRPDHLFPGNARINGQDAKSKGRSLTCERNGNAHLTNANVNEILSRYRRGAHHDNTLTLAKEFGVGQRTVWKIVNGVAWKSISQL